jgi:ATP-dependent Clp protease ATP-binding subunit ClpC
MPKGRQVSFKNTLIIMTSNIGSQVIEKGGAGLGFDMATTDEATTQYNNIRSLVNEEMKQYFRPELLNRMDEIIVFRQLSRQESQPGGRPDAPAGEPSGCQSDRW